MAARTEKVKASESVACRDFPCDDVKHECFIVPNIEVDPEYISAVLISEAAPDDLDDYYYASGSPLFEETTVQAFRDAGAAVSSMKDILELGVYLTTAVKCGKKGHGVRARTVKECSFLLEKELSLFPDVRVLLMMGDVAIKAVNYMARRNGLERPVPSGSTYKIRGGEFYFGKKRVFPSYLQAGPSFFIEKSKRRMIAEDVAAALQLVTSQKGHSG